MKLKRILIARHGESLGSIGKDVYPKDPDYALPRTEKGHKQAKQLRCESRV
jgi:broad specificity phosphatase PhoE